MRTGFNSSAIAEVAYCAEEMLLEIEFRAGSIYRYREVPEQTYRDFLSAESKGTFFNRFVKNAFAFARTQP